MKAQEFLSGSPDLIDKADQYSSELGTEGRPYSHDTDMYELFPEARLPYGRSSETVNQRKELAREEAAITTAEAYEEFCLTKIEQIEGLALAAIGTLQDRVSFAIDTGRDELRNQFPKRQQRKARQRLDSVYQECSRKSKVIFDPLRITVTYMEGRAANEVRTRADNWKLFQQVREPVTIAERECDFTIIYDDLRRAAEDYNRSLKDLDNKVTSYKDFLENRRQVSSNDAAVLKNLRRPESNSYEAMRNMAEEDYEFASNALLKAVQWYNRAMQIWFEGKDIPVALDLHPTDLKFPTDSAALLDEGVEEYEIHCPDWPFQDAYPATLLFRDTINRQILNALYRQIYLEVLKPMVESRRNEIRALTAAAENNTLSKLRKILSSKKPNFYKP
jgi:hypothetical protein